MKKSITLILLKTILIIKNIKMATFLKNKSKFESDSIVSALFKEFAKKNQNSENSEINVDTKSNEIADIISKKLLEKVEKNVVLK